MKNTRISDLIAILFVLLFLYSGISKIIDYSEFKEQIGNSLVPKFAAPITAAVVPSLQLLTVLIFIFLRWRLTVLYISISLMICFTLYLLIAFLFNRQLQFGVVGRGIQLPFELQMICNVTLIALAIIGIKSERRYQDAFYEKIISGITSITIATPKDLLG